MGQPEDEDIDKPSIPLKPSGNPGIPTILDPEDKFNVTEESNGYVNIPIEANPVPTFKFVKGTMDLPEGAKYTYRTDGTQGIVQLCLRKVKTNDEGNYKLILNNEHGEKAFDFEIFVSPKGGMDMRAMLRKKKKPGGAPKKELVDEFSIPLVDKSCKQGQDMEILFEAKFSKPSTTPPKWFFKDAALAESERHQQIAEKGMYYKMNLIQPIRSDMGRYGIEVNGVKSEAFLTVEGIYTGLDGLGYKGWSKRRLRIECTIRPGPAKVSWFKGEDKLEPGPQYEMDHDEETGICGLNFLDPNEEDTGEYKVVIEGDEDEESKTNVTFTDYPYKFAKPLASPIVKKEGEPAQIPVELDDEGGEVKWFLNDVEINIESDPRFVLVDEGKRKAIIIKELYTTDQGWIRCVTNADETKAEIRIKPSPKIKNGLDGEVETLEKESFMVEIEAENVETINWFMKGKPINDQRITTGNAYTNFYQLHFLPVELEDMGEISVQVGKTSSKCQLKVWKTEGIPQTLHFLPDVELGIRDPLVFNVPYTVSGKKTSNVYAKLYKDKVEIETKIKIIEDEAMFQIMKATRESSGLYTVKIGNARGETQRNVRIIFKDVPSSPETIDICDVNESTCVINWKHSPNNGGTPIIHYAIERKELGNDEDWATVAKTHPKSITFLIEDMKNGKEYKYRIRAVNQMGPSDPTYYQPTILAKDPYGKGMSGPRFLITPQSSLGYEDQQVSITCRVSANPPPVFTWFHKGVELVHCAKYIKRSTTENDYTFTINRLQLEDRGDYKLRFENPFGVKEAIVHINVQRTLPNEFTVTPYDYPSYKAGYRRTHDRFEYKKTLNQVWTRRYVSSPSYFCHFNYKNVTFDHSNAEKQTEMMESVNRESKSVHNVFNLKKFFNEEGTSNEESRRKTEEMSRTWKENGNEGLRENQRSQFKRSLENASEELRENQRMQFRRALESLSEDSHETQRQQMRRALISKASSEQDISSLSYTTKNDGMTITRRPCKYCHQLHHRKYIYTPRAEPEEWNASMSKQDKTRFSDYIIKMKAEEEYDRY